MIDTFNKFGSTSVSDLVLIIGTILSPVFYLIKRYFDLRSKKAEVNHQLFTEQKIAAISTFISASVTADQFWNEIPYFEIIAHRYSAKEMDQMILPIKKKFESAYYSAKLFLTDEEYAICTTIKDSTTEIHATLSNLYHHTRPADNRSTEVTNEYSFKVRANTKKNAVSRDKLCRQFQSMFK